MSSQYTEYKMPDPIQRQPVVPKASVQYDKEPVFESKPIQRQPVAPKMTMQFDDHLLDESKVPKFEDVLKKSQSARLPSDSDLGGNEPMLPPPPPMPELPQKPSLWQKIEE